MDVVAVQDAHPRSRLAKVWLLAPKVLIPTWLHLLWAPNRTATKAGDATCSAADPPTIITSDRHDLGGHTDA